MSDFSTLIEQILQDQLLIQAVFSSSRNKESNKVTIRPVIIKEKLLYQLSHFIENKVIHTNLDQKECARVILEELILTYKQLTLFTKEFDYHVLASQNGKSKILKKPSSKKLAILTHNRAKNYLLPEGKPLSFLIELGLMNPSGKVIPAKMDKFRQINRFLEIVDDTLGHIAQNKILHILDAGCGKAYLTFALYFFLSEIKGFEVHMTGVDLKGDVIERCQKLADKLGYVHLTFLKQDLGSFTAERNVDMVVSLHACDVASDFALKKAMELQAKVILAAPCCQHELYSQVSSKSLEAVLQYGILKERFSSLVTDAARAQILEMNGYSTQILEFIDSEHTPKNLLLRAVHGNSPEARSLAKERYLTLKQELHINPTLERLQK